MNGHGASDGLNRRAFLRAGSAAGVAVTAGLAGCIGTFSGGGDDNVEGGGSGSQSGPITFGQPSLLSGNLQFIQPPVSAAADLAARKINEAGGPLDRELRLKVRDTSRDPSQAEDVLDQHVSQDNVALVNGFTSTGLIPMWNRVQEVQVPIISMFAGARFFDDKGGDGGTPGDTSDDGWVWRTTGADSQHTAAGAVHAQREGVTRVGVINGNGAGARDWADAFLDAVRVIDGMEVVARVETASSNASYQRELDSVFSEDIDLMGLAIDANSAISVLRQWFASDHGGRVMISNPLFNQQIVDEVGETLADEWVRVSVPAIGGPWADTYQSEFQSFVSESSEHDEGLGQNNWSASAYDAVTVGALAVHRAGSTSHDAIQRNIGEVARSPGKKVSTFAEGKEALDNGEEVDFVGAQTTVDFNEFGDVFNLARVFQLSGDGFQQVDEVSAERIEGIVDRTRQLSGDS